MKTEKKRGAARTQLAVRDEWWTDERVQGFLDLQAPEGENPDFHVLHKAYQGMVPESFGRFVEYFVEAGRDLNARGREGKTISEVLSSHRHGGDYLDVINQYSTAAD